MPKKHPYLPSGDEWSRWLSTGQAGEILGRSGGAVRKYITSRAGSDTSLEISDELLARKLGHRWRVRLHHSLF